jgi:predicted ATPase/DNA-binding SARP family transcriptional activator
MVEKFVSGQPELVRIQLLGGFSIFFGNDPIPVELFRLRKARNLVKLLALSDNHQLHSEQLMELLWPEGDPSSASNNLHQALFAARRAFVLSGAAPGLYLVYENENLCLSSGIPVWVDVEHFENAAKTARKSQDIDAYCAAIELYPGDLLPEDRYADWTMDSRERLRQEYLGLLLELGSIYEANGDYKAAIQIFQKLIQADILNESAHVSLMRLYAMNGQRQAAVRQYQHLESVLQRELEIKPDPSSILVYKNILAGQFQSNTASRTHPSHAGPQHNLPTQVSHFIGRETEKGEVINGLVRSRLVTLTGPGGVGKTRLAIEVALEQVDSFTHGVWLVELASLSDPELVLHAVAGLFGLREDRNRSLLAVLLDYVRSRELLLVLDNCEHLVETCAQLAEKLLHASPGLRILATSREALEIPGEQVFLVPSLSTPDPLHPGSEENVQQYEAVQLFVERASLIMPGFCVTAENATKIAQICRQLDGIPLALELAAANINLLRVEQIAARLENRFSLLSGGSRTALPRQRTLRASIDWSYNLLDDAEQKLLHRLSVFSGGWTLEAAESVCFDETLQTSEILEILTRLSHKSLVVVQRGQGTPARYWLLETIRQYASAKLEVAGDVERFRNRHLKYYLEFAEAATPRLKSEYFLDVMRLLRAELENFRSALSWGLPEKINSRVEEGIRLLLALSLFWSRAGMVNEGHLWLMRGLAVTAGIGPRNIAFHGQILCQLAYYELDFAKAYKAAEESVAIFREIGDLAGLAEVLVHLGVRYIHSDHTQGRLILDESIRLYRLLDDPWGMAYALVQRGRLAHEERDFILLEACANESHDLFLKTGDRWNANIWPMGLLAHVAVYHLDFALAHSCIEQCLRSAQESGEASVEFEAIMYHGIISYFLGEFARMEADFHYILEKYMELGGGNLGINWALRCLGIAIKRQDKFQEAACYFQESLPLAIESDDRYGIYSAMAGIAGVSAPLGQPLLGARLLGAVEALFKTYTKPLDPMDYEEYQHDLAVIRNTLPDEAFIQAWSEGLTLSLEQTIQAVNALDLSIIPQK